MQTSGRAQAPGRVRAISLEPEEGRVQAVGRRAGGAPPNPGGAFARDPILWAIKVALRVLLSITLLELYTDLSLISNCRLHSPWTPTAPVPQVRGAADGPL